MKTTGVITRFYQFWGTHVSKNLKLILNDCILYLIKKIAQSQLVRLGY